MRLAVDLHSHSSYAGGVGKLDLKTVSTSMKLKGIDIFGSGDCLFPLRLKELQIQLEENAPGLYSCPGDKSKFVLQSEVIFTTMIPDHKNRIVAHHIILFPDFTTVTRMQLLLDKWGMKNSIGRPFLVSENREQLQDQLFEIANLHPLLEIIPAHIMTPDGIYGSRNNLQCLEEFYGGFMGNIRIIETGLSADPDMLADIPDLSDLTFISNSDCHSAALNRIGREFTIISADSISYNAVIKSLRENSIIMTVEFHPAEGRYYLTGHRSDRPHHKSAVFYDGELPADMICPVCGKRLLPGVKQRCADLRKKGSRTRNRKFLHLIPLVEVIAIAQRVRSVNSRAVISTFNSIVNIYGSEIALWMAEDIQEQLDKRVDPKTINKIITVQKGGFTFKPPGFDGLYGILHIGE
ncbi:MAG: hypothetical protein JXB60_05370 [Candidatus Cloacimonetes bacterium]|nr:hypothetical protein [Candidatus Cloacimonadota bacterium]